MSRIYNLGVERAFILSYDGWDEDESGVTFYNCDFRFQFAGFNADSMHLNYADSMVELYRDGHMVYTNAIKIVLD